jgi:hypothetical protein
VSAGVLHDWPWAEKALVLEHEDFASSHRSSIKTVDPRCGLIENADARTNYEFTFTFLIPSSSVQDSKPKARTRKQGGKMP